MRYDEVTNVLRTVGIRYGKRSTADLVLLYMGDDNMMTIMTIMMMIMMMIMMIMMSWRQVQVEQVR